MRLKHYINESMITKEDTFTILQNLYTKCMPFISDLVKGGWNYTLKGDTLMYSGRNNKNISFIGTVHKNRKPVDTNTKEHEFYDELFYKKFGWKARSNSIFCTGSKQIAHSYGNVYAIFPISKYKFIYNPNIKDLYSSFDAAEIKSNLYKNNMLMMMDFMKTNKGIKSTSYAIYNFLNRKSKLWKQYESEIYNTIVSKYKNDDIVKAIKSKKEIMVNCKEYYAISGTIEKNIKMYISENKTKYPDEKTFNFFWERWGNL